MKNGKADQGQDKNIFAPFDKVSHYLMLFQDLKVERQL